MKLQPISHVPLILATFLLHSGWSHALTEDEGFYDVPAINSGPDTVTGQGYSESPHRGRWFLNLGITGARGRMWVDSPTEIEVAYIFAGTPADGQLAVGDRIIGANGALFTTPHKFGYGMDKFGYEGPLMDLGNALDAVQGGNGQLTLDIVREGQPLTVTLTLPTNYGGFSPTYPFDCPKSDLILEELLAYLAGQQRVNGSWTERYYIDAHAVLAMLASLSEPGENPGDPPKYSQYLSNVKAAMQYFAGQTSTGYDTSSYPCWEYGLYGVCLAEYYLALDRFEGEAWALQELGVADLDEERAWLLPELEEINTWLGQAQLPGPFFRGDGNHGTGGWSHDPNPGSGYGPICMITAQAMAAWSLIAQCGIDVDQDRYNMAHEFLVKGTNNIGYVWYNDINSGDNQYADVGRTGAAVVAHAVAPSALAGGGFEPYARRSAQCIGVNPKTFPDTHGSPLLGAGWVALGAAFDSAAFRQLMDEHAWYFELAHCPDGTFYYQPNRDNNNQDIQRYSRLSASAAVALVLSIQHRSLRVMGTFNTPTPVLDLSAQPGKNKVTLTWLPFPGASAYTVKRSTVPGGPYDDTFDAGQETSYADTEVAAGTTYYYVVSATTVEGETGDSSEVAGTSTSGDTWYSAATSGATVVDDSTADWAATPSGSGGNPSALPVPGDSDTWVVQQDLRAGFTNTTWHGATSRVDGGDNHPSLGLLYAAGANLTFQDVYLNGGGLNSNGHVFAGNTLTVDATSGGYVGTEGGGATTLDFNAITGSGTLISIGIFDRRLDPESGGGAVIAAGTDLSGFTGLLKLEGKQDFWFAGSVTTATFGLEMVDADHNYVMQSGVDVKVTSAKFGETSLPTGAYTGTDLINLGLGAYITDNGGTLSVEPAALPVDPKITAISVSGSIATIVMKGTSGTDYYCAGSDDLTSWATEIVPT
ncbi:DUF6288 domain-containing protein, partial [Haloferula sp. A504]|uniref:DUF6288 domain-containing protein n=1 Tax=Haloferula sp. A504 TaxID=3373601 RepID=UPI0031CB56AB|nr:DUF6288 domain-containing protein [Verrucomicrobiaceae bacterium E54]